jgi:hypothetical protein
VRISSFPITHRVTLVVASAVDLALLEPNLRGQQMLAAAGGLGAALRNTAESVSDVSPAGRRFPGVVVWRGPTASRLRGCRSALTHWQVEHGR